MSGPISGLERAKSLHDMIDCEAPASEALGRLTDKVAAAMIDAGLFSQLLPASCGGLGKSISDFFETVEEIATADGSAGWCLSICGATNYTAYKGLPDKGREEVFGDGPVAMWTCLLPRATSEPEQGGFKVSGKFGWGSGSSVADWVLATESLPDRNGMQWFRSYVIPKSQVSIVPDSWQPLGLKATASVDYGIDGALVPAHRSFEYPVLDPAGKFPISTFESAAFHHIGMTAFASGVARRALSEFAATAPNVRHMKAAYSQAEDEATQQGLGEIEARLETTRVGYRALIAEQESTIARTGKPDPEITEKSLHTTVVLAQAARNAAVFAFDNASTGAILSHNPIQRCLRDLFAGLKHPAYSPIHVRGLGKAKMGIQQATLRLK